MSLLAARWQPSHWAAGLCANEDLSMCKLAFNPASYANLAWKQQDCPRVALLGWQAPAATAVDHDAPRVP
eukprot:5451292-Amphidinium_carterae.1